MKPLTAIARFLSCRKGSSAVEFSLTGGIVMIGFCMAAEVCGFLYAQHTVQTAANQAIRYAATGNPSAAERDQRVLDIIAGTSQGLVAPQSIADVAHSYDSFTDLEAGADGTPGLGGPDEIIAIELIVPWTGFTPVFDMFTQGLMVHARVAARNETFVETEPSS